MLVIGQLLLFFLNSRAGKDDFKETFEKEQLNRVLFDCRKALIA